LAGELLVLVAGVVMFVEVVVLADLLIMLVGAPVLLTAWAVVAGLVTMVEGVVCDVLVFVVMLYGEDVVLLLCE
jgi:hypothetical protein